MRARPFEWLLLLSIAALFPVVHLSAAELVVQVKSAALRAEPNHWARSLRSLSFGEKVTVSEGSNGWLPVVTQGGKKGFLHQSAVGESKLVLRSLGDASSPIGSNEIALAGKGFGDAAEKALGDSGGYDFLAISRVEKVKISDADLVRFRKEGKLS